MQACAVSDYRVTLGSTVLLDIGDLIYGDLPDLLRVSASFEGVEFVPFLGGGARSYEREGHGNRFHEIQFARVRIHDDVTAAKLFQLEHYATLPAGGQDCTIEFDGYGPNKKQTLHRASITAAPSFTLHRLSIFSYVIRGGSLATVLTDEEGVILTTEEGDPIIPG